MYTVYENIYEKNGREIKPIAKRVRLFSSGPTSICAEAQKKACGGGIDEQSVHWWINRVTMYSYCTHMSVRVSVCGVCVSCIRVYVRAIDICVYALSYI